jgi:GNAT superfamily N-acetyltransferase
VRAGRRRAGQLRERGWDGGSHAFILDTVVAARLRHQGTGTKLVAVAAERARAAGCAWLHVDFEPELGPFYWASCGSAPPPSACWLCEPLPGLQPAA